MYFRKKSSSSSSDDDSGSETDKFQIFNPNPKVEENSIRYPRIINFKNISGASGVFILGKKPYWGLSQRNFLRLFCLNHDINFSERFHPMSLEGEINCFTEFHNISNKHGFIYYAKKQSKMTIAQLDPSWDLQLTMPFRRVSLIANYLINNSVDSNERNSTSSCLSFAFTASDSNRFYFFLC